MFIDKDKYSQSDFRTLGGRTVKALGGITPDVEISVQPESDIHSALISKDMFFKFATYYISANPGTGPVEPDDRLFDEFKAFISQNGFSYDSKIERKLNELRELASSRNYGNEFDNSLRKIETQVETGEAEELNSAKEEILLSIYNEINKLRENEAEQIQATFPYDKQLQRALEVLGNTPEYNGILGK